MLRFTSRRRYHLFLARLRRGKNSLRRVVRALASTKRGVLHTAARDKSESFNCETKFRN